MWKGSVLGVCVCVCVCDGVVVVEEEEEGGGNNYGSMYPFPSLFLQVTTRIAPLKRKWHVERRHLLSKG